MSDEPKETRKEYLARKQAEKRARDKAEGAVVIRVRLSAKEVATWIRCGTLQRGNRETFAARALIMGAKFLANSGNPRGKKVRSHEKD